MRGGMRDHFKDFILLGVIKRSKSLLQKEIMLLLFQVLDGLPYPKFLTDTLQAYYK